jgi:hypothetical protein
MIPFDNALRQIGKWYVDSNAEFVGQRQRVLGLS